MVASIGHAAVDIVAALDNDAAAALANAAADQAGKIEPVHNYIGTTCGGHFVAADICLVRSLRVQQRLRRARVLRHLLSDVLAMRMECHVFAQQVRLHAADNTRRRSA